jgi:uncharacterized FlaG/YvyC family protein
MAARGLGAILKIRERNSIKAFSGAADKTNKVGAMDKALQVASVTTGAISAAVPAAPVSPVVRARNSAVVDAVRTLNESGVAGEGREVTFSLDRSTHIPVVKVVDKDTQEVITQWPSDYALRLAETTQGGGQIRDESILRTNDLNGQSG